MKRILPIFLCLTILVCIEVVSQAQNPSSDKLILNGGKIMNCKVLAVKADNIEIDPEGSIPFQTVKRVDVNTIIYANGTIVNLALNNQSNDFTPKDNNGSTIGTINLLSKKDISVKRDSKGLQKNDSKAEFYYKENGARKGMIVKISSSWRDWWAHSITKSNLAFSEFIIGIQVYNKETNELIGSKDYTFKENEYMILGSQSDRVIVWYSEPFSCQHWNFTITINTSITDWSLGTFSTSEVIKYDYYLDLKIETR